MSLLQALNLPSPPTSGSKPKTDTEAVERKTGVSAAKAEKLLQAAEAWRQTHGQANERITALKAAVKSHCADAPPALLQEIDKGLVKLDGVLKTVDQRLVDSLTSAGNAANDSARKAELEKAKAIVTEYINHVKGEPLVAHMDKNPFSAKTDLQALLAGGLAKVAQAIG